MMREAKKTELLAWANWNAGCRCAKEGIRPRHRYYSSLAYNDWSTSLIEQMRVEIDWNVMSNVWMNLIESVQNESTKEKLGAG